MPDGNDAWKKAQKDIDRHDAAVGAKNARDAKRQGKK